MYEVLWCEVIWYSYGRCEMQRIKLLLVFVICLFTHRSQGIAELMD